MKIIKIIIWIFALISILFILGRVKLKYNYSKAREIADEYVENKYGITPEYVRTNFVFIDIMGYYVYYIDHTNDIGDIKFSVIVDIKTRDCIDNYERTVDGLKREMLDKS